jgi:hypothetical protein
MATYQELLDASSDPTLNVKLRVAVVIAAEVVRTENPATTNHANRLKWAFNVFANPDGEARRMMWAVLAQNAAVPLATILAASDATVQTAVNAAVDVFAV